MSSYDDRRGQIADFRDSFERINWLYLLFKCGIKTKTHFEWLLWHWSSLGQLNLEPTRPNGLVGCKVPTDLVRINIKESTHIGFYYKLTLMFIALIVQVRCMVMANYNPDGAQYQISLSKLSKPPLSIYPSGKMLFCKSMTSMLWITLCCCDKYERNIQQITSVLIIKKM